MRLSIALAASLLALGFTVAPAAATSGFGCYAINLPQKRALDVRAKPRGKAEIVGSYKADNQPVIAFSGKSLSRGEGSSPELVDVWKAEFQDCMPKKRPVGARFCPVTVYDGDKKVSGWITRRLVDYAECP
ncbi:hypothetical protein [Acuticoccus mangrovi]|uniref:Secreted protein n=1 Tax=Acuticoccus mangrovi TaxID=2796142 RepID=A0A934IEY6_9HYPH|nr:hypothetical protein [Acuticoccus mangrovi]MBJ3775384.1 hypothetical protein [Acuticoccus mangrovi]